MTDQTLPLELLLEAQVRHFLDRTAASATPAPKRYLVADLEYQYDDARRDGYRKAEGASAPDRCRWPFHRVRAASWLPVTVRPGAPEAEFGPLTVLSASDHGEDAIVAALFEQMNAMADARVVSWGGEVKDFAVLRRSAAEFGLVVPARLRDLNPHSRDRLDLCSEVSGRAENVHLPEYCAATSIPSKPSQSKSIGSLVCVGKWDAVEDQVRADVLATTIILLRHLASRCEVDIDVPRSIQALATSAASSAPDSAFVADMLRPWARDLGRRAALRGRVHRAPI